MTFAYPLLLPTTRLPVKISYAPSAVVGLFKAARSLVRKTQTFEGQEWKLRLTLPEKMSQAEASEFQAFVLSMNGVEGTCHISPQDRKTPRGVGTGTPVVDGAGQLPRQNQLNVRGLTSDTVGILKKMDFLQLGTGLNVHLHALLEDADTDASGKTTLTLWPNIRETPNDGDPVIINSPVGLFALDSNDMNLGEVRAPLIYGGMILSVVEVL